MKCFFLGLGAQKAGTTWLHDYLARCPGFAGGFEKEYHILDAWHVPWSRRYLTGGVTRGLRALSALAGKRALRQVGYDRPDAHNRIDWARLRILRSRRAYVGYFAGLLAQPEITHSADITPEYAGVPLGVLRDIRQRFNEQGIAVRSVFLMRDPVERAWSAVRMYHRRGSDGAGETESETLARLYRSPAFQGMGRYEEIVPRLETALGPENVMLALYEDMFNAESLAQITRFLDISPATPDFGRHLNNSPKKADLPLNLRQQIAQFYAPSVAFAANRLGSDRIEQLWPASTEIDPRGQTEIALERFASAFG